MSYRFSDTSKWSDSWFIDLNAYEKLMFLYLCDNCDIAGFFELSLKKLSFDLGLSPDQIKGALKGLERGYILSNDRSILFIKNFVKHQKNMPLNSENKAHIGIFRRFENYKHKFDIDLIKFINKELIIGDIKGASKGLQSPIGKGIDTGIQLDIQINNRIDFEIFWDLYDKKVGDKKKCLKKWQHLPIKVQNKVIELLPIWKNQFEEKQFQPFPETFLNQERWNDELKNLKLIKNDSTTTIPTSREKFKL